MSRGTFDGLVTGLGHGPSESLCEGVKRVRWTRVSSPVTLGKDTPLNFNFLMSKIRVIIQPSGSL